MKIAIFVFCVHLLIVAGLIYLHPPAPKRTTQKPVHITTQLVLIEEKKAPVVVIKEESSPLPVATIEPPSVKEEQLVVTAPSPKPIEIPVKTPKPEVKSADPPKPKPAPVSKKEVPKAPSQNEKLIALMKESLAKLNSNPQKTTTATAPKSAIGPLASETLAFETRYEEELTLYLQTLVALPEKGEVKLKLSLKREGIVQKIEILKASSEKNRAFLETALIALTFPPFGQHYKGEGSHTFTVTLKAD